MIKSSYLAAKTSGEGIDSVAQKKSSGTINGKNGVASTWPSYREGFLLHAYEDEYGGIIVNPGRLPRNTNIFSAVLQRSLSHWRLQVI